LGGQRFDQFQVPGEKEKETKGVRQSCLAEQF
jgi:hypothetical protein